MTYKTDHEQEIQKLYMNYEEIITNCQTYEDGLNICMKIYDEMSDINKRYCTSAYTQKLDNYAIYFIAKYVLEKNSNIFRSITESSPEKKAKEIASIIYHRLKKKNRVAVYAVEPHPDDVLGSASGLCYNEKNVTVLYTISKCNDDRDNVSLGDGEFLKYKSIKRPMNISRHLKYNIPDLHYDTRTDKDFTSFADLVELYKKNYSSLPKLTESLTEVVRKAKEDNAYIAFPLGIEHPMHIITMAVCLSAIKDQNFNTDRIIVYIDHPYDFFYVSTDRLLKVRDYIQSALDIELIRCDDTDAKPELMEPIIKEIYGEKPFGDFDGTLNRTLCSYFINKNNYEDMKDLFSLHYNNVLYVSSQAKPYFKTGGLGEVAFSYCKALQSYVNDVRILMPKYPHVKADDYGKYEISFSFQYEHRSGIYNCTIEKRKYENIIYYLLSMTDPLGQELTFMDNYTQGKEFALFCDAVIKTALRTIDYNPTVVHCNDWQTSLLPFLMKTKYKYGDQPPKTIYTIHFYGYKGIYPKKDMLSWLDMDENDCKLCISCSGDCLLNKLDLLTERDRQNLVQMPPSLMCALRAGVEFSDAVTTVSHGYASDLQYTAELENKKIIGIRNGISDIRDKYWNYMKFPVPLSGDAEACEKMQNLRDFMNTKVRQKALLQEKLGLEKDKNIPIICMVSRLSIEKGIELLKNIIPYIFDLRDQKVQIVIVGDDTVRLGGHRPYAEYFEGVEKERKGYFAYRSFSEELEYETYAGSDILIMPSLSEACGTTQMLAMRYGVVPLVSMLSSFQDTVLDYRYKDKRGNGNLDKGIGFYAYKDDCWVFLEVIRKMLSIYHNQPEWEYIVDACRQTDFGWRNTSIYKYVKLYNSIK